MGTDIEAHSQTLGRARKTLQKWWGRILRARVVKDSRRTWPTESTKWGSQSSHRPKCSRVCVQGPLSTLPTCCSCLTWGFCGTPNNESEVSLTFLPIHETFFLLLGYLVQPWYWHEGICLVLLQLAMLCSISITGRPALF